MFVSLTVDANEFVFEVKNQDSLLIEKLGTGLAINDKTVNELADINALEFEITKLPSSSITRRRDSSQT